MIYLTRRSLIIVQKFLDRQSQAGLMPKGWGRARVSALKEMIEEEGWLGR